MNDTDEMIKITIVMRRDGVIDVAQDVSKEIHNGVARTLMLGMLTVAETCYADGLKFNNHKGEPT